MPNITDYAEGEFAKVGISINEGTVVKFLDAGKLEKSAFGKKGEEKKDTFSVTVLINNKKKMVSLNSKSTRNLGEAWGFDTSKWIGKEAQIHLEDKNVFGIIKKVAYYSPSKGLASAAKKSGTTQRTQPATPEQEAKAAEIADYLRNSETLEQLEERKQEMRVDAGKLPKNLFDWIKGEVESITTNLKETQAG